MYKSTKCPYIMYKIAQLGSLSENLLPHSSPSLFHLFHHSRQSVANTCTFYTVITPKIYLSSQCTTPLHTPTLS